MKNRPPQVKRIMPKPRSDSSDVSSTIHEQPQPQPQPPTPQFRFKVTSADEGTSEYGEDSVMDIDEGDEGIVEVIMEEKNDSEIYAESPVSIVGRIADLPESDIGKVPKFSSSFKRLSKAMKSVRDRKYPYDSDEPEKITEIVNSDNTKEAFNGFRGSYEFIIHLHNLSEVKLHRDTPDEEDTILRGILETSFRKLKNRVGNICTIDSRCLFSVLFCNQK